MSAKKRGDISEYIFNYVNWDSLRKFIGKPIQSGYWVWLIGLPIVSIVVIKLQFAWHSISVKLEKSLGLSDGLLSSVIIEVPMSWKVIYFSIVLLLTANKFYGIFCPKLVMCCTNYQDFLSSSISPSQLSPYIRDKASDVAEYQRLKLGELEAKYKVAYSSASKSNIFLLLAVVVLYVFGTAGLLSQFVRGALAVINA